MEENKSDIEEQKDERRPMTIKKHSNLLEPVGPNSNCGGAQELPMPKPRYASSMNVCAGGSASHDEKGRRSSPKKKRMNLDAMGPKKGKEELGRLGGGEELAEIREEEDGDEMAMDLPSKPSYFNMFDDVELDSEEEMVAGENNYIEIDCLPLEGQPRNPAPAAAAEENKQ